MRWCWFESAHVQFTISCGTALATRWGTLNVRFNCVFISYDPTYGIGHEYLKVVTNLNRQQHPSPTCYIETFVQFQGLHCHDFQLPTKFCFLLAIHASGSLQPIQTYSKTLFFKLKDVRPRRESIESCRPRTSCGRLDGHGLFKFWIFTPLLTPSIFPSRFLISIIQLWEFFGQAFWVWIKIS